MSTFNGRNIFNSGNVGSVAGGGASQHLLTTASANYTILAADDIIKVTTSGVTITLITAIGRLGKAFNIDNASSGNITLNTSLSQTIHGELTQTIPPNSAVSVYSDGANYRIF